jgi:hypothetical protein
MNLYRSDRSLGKMQSSNPRRDAMANLNDLFLRFAIGIFQNPRFLYRVGTDLNTSTRERLLRRREIEA